MSNVFGENIKITVFGQSHSPAIGVVIDGFPSGLKVDLDNINEFMARRAPGQKLTTMRKEADTPQFISGLNSDGKTCGAPICAVINNTDTRSKDYSNLLTVPRPSHSDYTSFLKYGEARDVRGGGQFSGRLTAPLCVAGALAIAWLKDRGVKIGAHLYSVGKIKDDGYDAVNGQIPDNVNGFPAVNKLVAEKMQEEIEKARMDCDSVGAVVECKINGVPAALGDPMFDGVENRLAQMMFSIPAVKGFEVGAGFDVSGMCGSECNDQMSVRDGKIVTDTNNAGGINGGITNGMPITFKVGFKPTPSIAKSQKSVNINTLAEEELIIHGRHDPCIGVRAVPVVEACAAIVIMDLMQK